MLRSKTSLAISIFFVFCMAMASSLFADVPHLINYQGHVSDAEGTPLDAIVSMTFAIYNASTGGSSIWSEIQATVIIVTGQFSVQLGSVVPLNDSVFSSTDCYLGVSIGTDSEIVPRTRLTAVPYSQRVSTVDGTTGGTIAGSLTITTGTKGKEDIAGDLNVAGKATIGLDHTNSGDYAFVAGSGNTASGNSAAVSGGHLNEASGNYSTIGGGELNIANGFKATVGGGENNTANGIFAAIGGGQSNEASHYSTVNGGQNNAASVDWATIGGGEGNTASGINSTIGGGNSNTASGDSSTIGGGYSNSALYRYVTIGGGQSNTAGGNSATVGGGRLNDASGNYATISGGELNIANGFKATVGGGENNSANGIYASVGGGQSNDASHYATVGGGQNNAASVDWATIGGGEENTASGLYSTVGGGSNNVAAGLYCTIAGGNGNFINEWSENSAILGGDSNLIINGYDATILGGHRCTLSTVNSLLFGGYGAHLDGYTWYTAAFFGSINPGRIVINRATGGLISHHVIHAGTNAGNGNGAYLSGTGIWTDASSRESVESLQPLDTRELLSKISGLSVGVWNYKDSEERHIGPVAEDFVEAFDVGVIREEDGRRDNQYLAAKDVSGVALAGVKAILEKMERLEEINAKLEKRIAELEKQIQKE